VNQKTTLKPVRRDRIRDQVFEQLKDQIFKGSWQPGSKIPSENELAAMLGVSRVSIREGLQKLVTLGILDTRHGEGTYVKEFSSDIHLNTLFPLLALDRMNILQVLEYRKVMDTGSVELAVERATEEDLQDMERIYASMTENSDEAGDLSKFAEADLEFHLAVSRATKNPVFIKVNSIIKDILSVSMEGIVRTLGKHDGLHYHRRILDAIRKRDEEEAKRLMEEHVLMTIDRLKKMEDSF